VLAVIAIYWLFLRWGSS